MDKEMLQEKILRWQLLADQWFSENQNIYIKTIDGNFHFCKIVMVGETKITVDNYGPEQRAGTRDYLEWLEIEKFEKIKENEKR